MKLIASSIVHIADEIYVGGIKAEIRDEKIVESMLEQPAGFPGGEDEMMRWISEHLTYTPEMVDNNLEGRVVISFLVNEDGKVSETKILTSPHQLLSEAATQVVMTLPDFIPARMNGTPISQWFTLPINFKVK